MPPTVSENANPFVSNIDEAVGKKRLSLLSNPPGAIRLMPLAPPAPEMPVMVYWPPPLLVAVSVAEPLAPPPDPAMAKTSA